MDRSPPPVDFLSDRLPKLLSTLYSLFTLVVPVHMYLYMCKHASWKETKKHVYFKL